MQDKYMYIAHFTHKCKSMNLKQLENHNKVFIVVSGLLQYTDRIIK